MLSSVLAVFALGAISCHSPEKKLPKISIFCDHIESIVRQQGISFAEAAAALKEAGYQGADIRVFQRPEEIRILDSLGFEHACAITDIDYSKGEQKELEDATLAFMEEKGFDRLLLVPGLVPADFTDADKNAERQRIAAFAARVAAKGYTIMVEDYDNNRSLCYNAERIDSLFAVSRDLELVFDTGNFLFAGEDAMEQFTHFRNRIAHVHLKDRTAPDDMACVPAGEGCIPIAEIVRQLLADGYDGWLTVEQYGSRNMLEDSKTAIRNVSALLAGK